MHAILSKKNIYLTVITIFVFCLELIGLAVFMAEQRIKEIGIRKVLGASLSSIITLLPANFLKLVLIAFVIASPLPGLPSTIGYKTCL